MEEEAAATAAVNSKEVAGRDSKSGRSQSARVLYTLKQEAAGRGHWSRTR